MKTRPRFKTSLAGLCLTLGACGALAAEPAPRNQTAAVPAPDTTTGADAAAPAADHPIALRKESSIVVTVHPDGSSSAVLDDSFLSTSVARVDADGRVIIGCVSTREEYNAFFAAKSLPAGPEVR